MAATLAHLASISPTWMNAPQPPCPRRARPFRVLFLGDSFSFLVFSISRGFKNKGSATAAKTANTDVFIFIYEYAYNV